MKVVTTNGPEGPQSLTGLVGKLAPSSQVLRFLDRHEVRSVRLPLALGDKRVRLAFIETRCLGHQLRGREDLDVHIVEAVRPGDVDLAIVRNPVGDAPSIGTPDKDSLAKCHLRFPLSDRIADTCILPERSTPTPQQSGEGKG